MITKTELKFSELSFDFICSLTKKQTIMMKKIMWANYPSIKNPKTEKERCLFLLDHYLDLKIDFFKKTNIN